MAKKKGKDVIKSTKYCDLLRQASLVDEDYTYCIERIYVKAKKMEEIRFTLYKETLKSGNRYIPRSLDVTEIELIKLIRSSLEGNVFSAGFIKMLKEEISSVEKLINSISNEELMEEFLNDWSMSVKIAKEIGENEVDDRVVSMYQNLKSNGLEELSIGHVINWCNELDEQGYVMLDDYSIIYKSSANLKDVARRLLDELLDDAIYVDSLIDKDSLVEYWIEQTSKEDVIDDLIRGSNIEELLGLAPETIYEDEYNKYLYSEIDC